jgi:two-component system KDP operon response regulator KdpE
MARETILIVDDNELVRRALDVQLRGVGFRTIFAADAIGAVGVARRESPDLIILDIGLPGGDGVLVLERLRAIPSVGCTPVIVLTGRDPEERWRCLDAGAVGFYQKPVAWAELLGGIQRALAVPERAGVALAGVS